MVELETNRFLKPIVTTSKNIEEILIRFFSPATSLDYIGRIKTMGENTFFFYTYICPLLMKQVLSDFLGS